MGPSAASHVVGLGGSSCADRGRGIRAPLRRHLVRTRGPQLAARDADLFVELLFMSGLSAGARFESRDASPPATPPATAPTSAPTGPPTAPNPAPASAPTPTPMASFACVSVLAEPRSSVSYSSGVFSVMTCSFGLDVRCLPDRGKHGSCQRCAPGPDPGSPGSQRDRRRPQFGRITPSLSASSTASVFEATASLW